MAKPVELAANVATAIARLCCDANHLPQGAPTSPVLANLVCMRLDGELLRLARSLGCTYTRYADDLTLSTHRRVFPEALATAKSPPYGTAAVLGPPLESLIRGNAFEVSELKVRLYGRQTSQRVTGLVVNEFPNVHRRFVRDIRGMIHAWSTHGLPAAESAFTAKYAKRHRAPHRKPPSFKNALAGKLQFLAMVRGPGNAAFIRMAKQCRALDPTLFPHALDGEERVDRSVWVLESESTSSQGTAFFVEGIGLVTCYHVLAPDTKASHPSDLHTTYAVTLKAYSEHMDLAILDVAIPSPVSLSLSDTDNLMRHQKIMLAGYPNFGYGDTLYKVWGAAAMTKTRSGLTYFVPSFPIAGGNSGGPLLDERYRVVGIAVRGVKSLLAASDANVDAFAAISIKHLRAVAVS